MDTHKTNLESLPSFIEGPAEALYIPFTKTLVEELSAQLRTDGLGLQQAPPKWSINKLCDFINLARFLELVIPPLYLEICENYVDQSDLLSPLPAADIDQRFLDENPLYLLTDPDLIKKLINTKRSRIKIRPARSVETGTRFQATQGAASPYGELIAIAEERGCIHLKNRTTLEPIHSIQAYVPYLPDSAIRSLVWNPEGTNLMVTSLRGISKLIDARTGTILHEFRDRTLAGQPVCSSDGTTWFLPNIREIIQYDGTNETIIHPLEGLPEDPSIELQQIEEITLSHDDTKIAARIGRNLMLMINRTVDHTIWNKRFRIRSNTFGTERLVFSFDPATGHLLIAGTADGHAQLLNSSTGKTIHQYTGHASPINLVSYNNSGSMLMTIDQEGIGILYTTSTQQPLWQQSDFRSSGNKCMWSPDNRFFLSHSQDYTAILYTSITGSRANIPQGKSLYLWADNDTIITTLIGPVLLHQFNLADIIRADEDTLVKAWTTPKTGQPILYPLKPQPLPESASSSEA